MKRDTFPLKSIIVFTMLLIFVACSREKKDWDRTKQLMSVGAFESFIKAHPESHLLDSARYYIERLSYNRCMILNTTEGFEDFLKKYPGSPYQGQIQEQLVKKSICREMAIKIFSQAQQAQSAHEKRKLFYKTDSLFYEANFTEFMCDAFQYPTLNLHFANGKELTDRVQHEFTTVRYTYGKPATDYFTYDLKNGRLGKVITYKIYLASTGTTRFRIGFQLLRQGRVIENMKADTFTVRSDYYNSYIGFVKHDSVNTKPNDQLRISLTATGDNYGILGGNYKSFIKGVDPAQGLDSSLMNERKKAITWCVLNSKWSHPGDFILDFIAELDYCIMNHKNAHWNFGWGSQKDDNAYQALWKDDHFSLKKFTLEEAGVMGIRDNAMDFEAN